MTKQEFESIIEGNVTDKEFETIHRAYHALLPISKPSFGRLFRERGFEGLTSMLADSLERSGNAVAAYRQRLEEVHQNNRNCAFTVIDTAERLRKAKGGMMGPVVDDVAESLDALATCLHGDYCELVNYKLYNDIALSADDLAYVRANLSTWLQIINETKQETT